ncbi:hypothetical protein [Sphingopyxis terrae]|uniref:hypothetical protein n=1 Tax=Sphingopyxis terrae TaxID=33052 RepID=UPI002A129E7E|nr:hypothetical protein [Sphingopyxis terrae]MDX8356392.1 hypothetical protein [Sphingopyxis terrae]
MTDHAGPHRRAFAAPLNHQRLVTSIAVAVNIGDIPAPLHGEFFSRNPVVRTCALLRSPAQHSHRGNIIRRRESIENPTVT